MAPHFYLQSEHELRALLARRDVHVVFQPIFTLNGAEVHGFEALARGPAGSELHQPDVLFEVARHAGLMEELEMLCCQQAIARFGALDLPGRLFLNASALAIERLAEHGCVDLSAWCVAAGVAPSRILLELTEHQRVTDPQPLREALGRLRALGLQLALDDFGDGRSSMRLWVELEPELVKLDMFFTRGIDTDSRKLEAVKVIARFAEAMGTQLVGEGVETEAELAVLRDLHVQLGQGYLMGRPADAPEVRLPAALKNVLADRRLAVFPRAARRAGAGATVTQLLVTAPTVTSQTPNNELVQLFERHPQLHGVAVVDNGFPVGIVNRRAFVDLYARPYHKEVYGRRHCALFMNPSPLRVEASTPLDSLASVLTGDDQRYLQDGFIITDSGRYLGIGTGEALVRAVTDLRMEAARHANPLTALPGNIPISQHIERLLSADVGFAAAYFDMNHFKPYNDLYGYFRGDAMIRLAAQCIQAQADPLRDFVGHVGGDDFVVLLQSDDWRERCARVVADFNRQARQLFDPVELECGVMRAEDRHGNPTEFPLTTLACGVVWVTPGRFRDAEEVASAAAAAKRIAKTLPDGLGIECAMADEAACRAVGVAA